MMVRKPYKSDLTDREWEVLKALIPPPKPGGRPRSVNVREILNAIFYVLRTGCSWNMLPHDFPPSSTVYYYFRRWQRKGVWEEMEATLQRLGRKALRAGSNNGADEQVTVAEEREASVPTVAQMPTPISAARELSSVRRRA